MRSGLKRKPMRLAVAAIAGLACLVAGAPCLPFIDEDKRTAEPGTSLAIAIVEPTRALTVTAGNPVHIEWTAANLTGDSATVSVILESRTDLTQAVLLDSLGLNGTGGSGSLTWDTTGFTGPYSIIARVVTPNLTAEGKSPALVTVSP